MRPNTVDDFWMNVEKTDGCWNWTGYLQSDGYGSFPFRNTTYKAHRLSYELAHGKIEAGAEIDHICRNRRCVNPAHLEAVTHNENMKRKIFNPATHPELRKTHCPRGHAYSPENTRVTHGSRRCRACDRERAAEKRAQQRRK